MFVQTGRKILLTNEYDEETLADVLKQAKESYENDPDAENLTDKEYDSLELLLRELNPNNPVLSEVGSDVRGGKVDLPIPMGSLDQVYEGDTQKWIKENRWENEVFVLSDKQDGTSALNVYGRGGKFKIAYSRGNGFQGADITRHIKKMDCFVSKTSKQCMVREEVIIPDHVFEAWQKHCEETGQHVYKNPRNYVAGRMNASESTDWFYENVHIIATSVVEPKMSKTEQFKFLEENGFEVTSYITKLGHELTDEFLEQYLAERRKESKTAIDGIVIDLDNADIRASLRKKSSSINPAYSKKFKIGAEENIAYPKVTGVSYRLSKHGYLKPRVHIEPTELCGVTISNVTGHNAKFIKDNGIGPGATIVLTRSGDVIPYIQGMVESVNPELPTEEEFGELNWTENEVDLFITHDNEDIVLRQLADAFNVLGVENFRQASIDKAIEAGYNTIEKIVKLDEATLQSLVGDASGTKAFSSIKQRLNPVELHVLGSASQTFGRGLGRRKLIKIVEHYGEAKFLDGSLTKEDVMKVESFSEKTSSLFIKNLPKFLKFLEDIKGYYTLKELEGEKEGDLSGVNFMFTGFRDKAAEEVIKNRGGKIQSSVNKDTTYLVTKDVNSTSSKAKKARDLGVKIIDPIEFKDLLK